MPLSRIFTDALKLYVNAMLFVNLPGDCVRCLNKELGLETHSLNTFT